MLRLNTSSLIDSILQLLKIQPDVLHAITDEICGANIPYKALYTDSQLGGWYTVTLHIEGYKLEPLVR